MNRIGALLVSGNVPLVAVLLLASGAFFVGRSSVRPHERWAVAEKGAVVMEAVLQRPQMSPQAVEHDVVEPILHVLSRYQNAGYTVVNVSRDERGWMAVDAVPDDALDITNELRQAVGLQAATKATLPPAAKPASGAK